MLIDREANKLYAIKKTHVYNPILLYIFGYCWILVSPAERTDFDLSTEASYVRDKV